MPHFKKSGLNLYVSEMPSGKIQMKPSRGLSCFFIAEHTSDEEYIEDLAKELLLAGCRSFDFYGANEPKWHITVDLTFIRLFPDYKQEDIALTSGWDRIKDFVEAIEVECACRRSVAHDIYLFYDDVSLYEKIRKRLNKRRK